MKLDSYLGISVKPKMLERLERNIDNALQYTSKKGLSERTTFFQELRPTIDKKDLI